MVVILPLFPYTGAFPSDHPCRKIRPGCKIGSRVWVLTSRKPKSSSPVILGLENFYLKKDLGQTYLVVGAKTIKKINNKVGGYIKLQLKTILIMEQKFAFTLELPDSQSELLGGNSLPILNNKAGEELTPTEIFSRAITNWDKESPEAKESLQEHRMAFLVALVELNLRQIPAFDFTNTDVSSFLASRTEKELLSLNSDVQKVLEHDQDCLDALDNIGTEFGIEADLSVYEEVAVSEVAEALKAAIENQEVAPVQEEEGGEKLSEETTPAITSAADVEIPDTEKVEVEITTPQEREQLLKLRIAQMRRAQLQDSTTLLQMAMARVTSVQQDLAEEEKELSALPEKTA